MGRHQNRRLRERHQGRTAALCGLPTRRRRSILEANHDKGFRKETVGRTLYCQNGQPKLPIPFYLDQSDERGLETTWIPMERMGRSGLGNRILKSFNEHYTPAPQRNDYSPSTHPETLDNSKVDGS